MESTEADRACPSALCSRRGMLYTAIAAAIGAGGLATATAAARRSTPSEPKQAPPHLVTKHY